MNEKSRLVKKGTEQTQKVEPQKRKESAGEMEARLRREWMGKREGGSRSDPRSEFRRLFKD